MAYIKHKRPFNEQQLRYMFKSIVAIIFQFVYLLRVAETSKEYMNSIFMTTVGTLVFVSHISTTIKMDKIFIFIDTLEKIINQSEFY